MPSFCSVHPAVVPRYVSFAETVGAIWRHLTGRPKPTTRERWLAERTIERLAEEMETEAETGMRDKVSSVSETKSHETKSHG